MRPNLSKGLLKNELLLFLSLFLIVGAVVIFIFWVREGQSYHVSAANPTCEKSSASSSVDCSCCHKAMGGILLKKTVNGKQIFGNYYDTNGYVYVLARARHDGSVPVITVGPSVINLNYTSATVTWTTSENATSWVDFGLTNGYGNNAGNGSYVSAHSVDLTGLVNHNTYHYRITTADALGNTLVTGDYTFNLNLPPPVPTVIDQPNWVAGSSPFTVTLNWNAVTDPDGGAVEYEVIIDDDPNFASPNYTSPWLSPTSWAADVARGYYYYWKVRSRDAAHPEVNSAWSASDVFYVFSAYPPPLPAIISPLNSCIGYDFCDGTYDLFYPVGFSWGSVTAPDGDPVQYLIEVSQAADFSVPYANSGWLSTAGWSLNVGAGAIYYWRIKTRDAVHTDAISDWSRAYSMNISSYAGSCPLVYAWTGRGFTYQTDVQGGVLGMPQLPADRVKLYKEVYVKMPSIKPDARGHYVIKLREAQREMDYVDQLKLLVVDHPAGTSVYDATAMNTNSFGYRTEPEIYTVKRPRLPLKAWDKNDKDILALLSKVDNRPAPANKTEVDYYTFDFGEIKNTDHVKLLIDGWTVFGLTGMPKEPVVQPYIELLAADGITWQKVKDIGIPAGDLKTLVVDLGGLFMNPEDQRIRLYTGRMKSAKFVVDGVTLDESAPVAVRTQLLTASAADLHHPGRPPFSPASLNSRIYSRDAVLADVPEAYFYGAFTRYGDVTELINQTDDKFVIMRHGDELTVTFPRPAPQPLVYKRTILLMADLYYKGRGNSTVDPLPFHGMSSYPYPSTESYPQDAEHKDYLKNYHTRVYEKPSYLNQGLAAASHSPSTGIMLALDYLQRKGREYLQKTLALVARAGKGLERTLSLASADFTPRHYSLNTDYVEIRVRDKTILNSVNYKAASPGTAAWESDSWMAPASPGTPFTDAQKAAINVMDNIHWTTSLVSGDNTYNYQMYRFQVVSSWLTNLGQIDVTWRGYGEPTPGYNVDLYLWNFTTNSWETMSSFFAPSNVTNVGYRRTFFDAAGRGLEQFCTACHQSNYHQYCIDCHGSDPVSPTAALTTPGMICTWCHDHNSIVSFADPPSDPNTMWGMPDGCDHCHGGWFPWGYVSDYTPPSITSGPTITNLTDTSVTISWSVSEWSASQVNYGTTTSYGKSQTTSTWWNQSVTLTELTPGTAYHYQLKCTDAIGNVFKSGDYTFTTLWAIPPTTPVLIDQPDAIYFGSTYTVTLSWNPSTQPQGYLVEYQAVIDDDFNFGSPNYTLPWQSGTSWTVDVAAPADYYWRVQARAVEPITGNTQASPWSIPDSFFIMNASPPLAPTLIPPPDASTGDYTYAITLQWNPVTAPDGDPVEYYAQISQAADFSSIYNSRTWGATTTWLLTVDSGYTYYWRVSARDAVHPSAASAWSAADSFYIEYVAPSSCPFIYVWDGEKYQYQTDIQGEVLAVPQTNPLYKNLTLYGPSYYVLNDLLPDGDNLYRVKIREVQAESDYFDEAKLLLADYPAGYEIVSSSADNTYYSGYVNPFKIYTLKDPRPPIAAVDQNGNDILNKVLAADNNPAPPDIQAPEYYTFDFGPIAHPENAKLVLDGWSLYGKNAYKVVPDLPNIDPCVELINAQGQWQKVKTFGFISGDLKTMVVDLSGLFMSSDHRIRVNLGFYKPVRTIIDRVRLDDSAPVAVTVTELPALSADLRHGGMATVDFGDLEHRHLALDDVQPDVEAWYMYGAFTRYGEVSPLLSADDDQLVLMRQGDELSFIFPNISPPPYGMERKALLKADVYYKSNKLSNKVDPLPYHGMTAYPPDPWLGPTSSDYQQYLEDYNTRVYEQPQP